jgi:hypothetical protein
MSDMTLKELFERYGDLRNLDPKTMVLYEMLLGRLRTHLGHEPTVLDLDDLTISRYLRARATDLHKGRPIRPASVQKDKVMIAAVWNLAARKRWVIATRAACGRRSSCSANSLASATGASTASAAHEPHTLPWQAARPQQRRYSTTATRRCSSGT